jgi:hypothetical protein
MLDIKIFISTIKAVLRHEGISGEGAETMTEFMGNEKK